MEKETQDIREAKNYLLYEVISGLAKNLVSRQPALPLDWSAVLHEQGVNVRWLGHVYFALGRAGAAEPTASLQQDALIEMVARVAKRMLRLALYSRDTLGLASVLLALARAGEDTLTLIRHETKEKFPLLSERADCLGKMITPELLKAALPRILACSGVIANEQRPVTQESLLEAIKGLPVDDELSAAKLLKKMECLRLQVTHESAKPPALQVCALSCSAGHTAIMIFIHNGSILLMWCKLVRLGAGPEPAPQA